MKKILAGLFSLIVLGSIGLVVVSDLIKQEPLVLPGLGSRAIAAENIWFPKESSVSAGPEVNAQAAFFMETKTGRVLYQKNRHLRLPVASLTKIMTVIVAMEHKQMKDQFMVSQAAADMEPDKMLLIAGERLSLEELLDGIFLVSANDASEVLAEGVTGRREEFISMMNAKASSIGMVDSLFINPTGLEEDPSTGSGQVVEQYSSAYDVALMSRYAIYRWPQLVEISSQPRIFLPQTQTHQDYDLNSGINLLTTYPGVVGFKTGFTPEAGMTLTTLARRGGHEVLGVLLNAEDRRGEAKTLLDYSFEQLGVN